MISKNKNLFLKIYIPFVILTIIALIVLQILGSKILQIIFIILEFVIMTKHLGITIFTEFILIYQICLII